MYPQQNILYSESFVLLFTLHFIRYFSNWWDSVSILEYETSYAVVNVLEAAKAAFGNFKIDHTKTASVSLIWIYNPSKGDISEAYLPIDLFQDRTRLVATYVAP